MELNRIASHLFALATGALDLGAVTMLRGCRDRDLVLDLFEMSSGQRMHPRYIQVGGVFEDIPPGWVEKTRKFLKLMPTRLDQYEDLLDRNEIWLERLKGTGVISQERALELGVTGPLLRATGHPGTCARRCRTRPTSSSTSTCRSATTATTTTASRCAWTRCASRSGSSSRRSTGCPRATTSPPTARSLPPRHELATSMEALIHHFKLVTEGFRVPPGEAYTAIESPRGELGCYVLADGSAKPARVHMRDPSFVNLMSLPDMARDSLIADFIACVAMLDPILGGGWTGDRRSGRHPRGSAAARLGRGCGPRRRPGDDPRSRLDRGPGGLRAEIEGTWRSTPTATRRPCPRSAPRSACTAGARPRRSTRWPRSCRSRPAYLSSVATFYDMLRTEPVGSHYVTTSARASPATCATPSRSTRRSSGRSTRASRTSSCASSSASAPRHGADGVDRRPLRRAALRGRRADLVGALKEGREPCPAAACPTPASAVGRGGAAPDRPGRPRSRTCTRPAAPGRTPRCSTPPAEGPPPHPRSIPQPLDPGTSVVPDDEEDTEE